MSNLAVIDISSSGDNIVIPGQAGAVIQVLRTYP